MSNNIKKCWLAIAVVFFSLTSISAMAASTWVPGHYNSHHKWVHGHRVYHSHHHRVDHHHHHYNHHKHYHSVYVPGHAYTHRVWVHGHRVNGKMVHGHYKTVHGKTKGHYVKRYN